MKFATILLLGACCHGSEITIEEIAGAVCQAETNTVLLSNGHVSGLWHVGAYGEAGPWQCTKEVAKDLGMSWSRISREPAYARRAFDTWYKHLYEKTGSHAEALKAYHRGLGGRNKAEAKDYSIRVLNLAATLQSKAAQQ